MIPLDLSGKVALVTGVGDNQSFAWFIAKALQAAGAKLVFACHPRMVGIVENLLENTKEDDVEARVCLTAPASSRWTRSWPATSAFDNMETVDEKTRNDRRWAKHGDFTIKGMIDQVGSALRPRRHPDPQRRLQPRNQEQGPRHEPQRLFAGAQHQRAIR